MITLTRGNSYSSVLGLSSLQHKALKSLLSYELSLFLGGAPTTVRKPLLDRRGSFPSGLFDMVLDHLKLYKLSYALTDSRIKPTDASRKAIGLKLPVTPYLNQGRAVAACLERSRGTIEMVTGYGKSITMACLINELKLKTLIIVPNLQLKQQLTENFKKYFGSLKHITIKNIDSSDLDSHTDYDCLIIDESHHVAAKTYTNLNKKAWNKIYYRFFFTGTPFRNKTEEQMLMQSISGDIIYRVGYDEAVKEGAIVPVEAYYQEMDRKDTDGYTYSEVYSDLVVNNTPRNAHIASLLNDLTLAKASGLCLVKEINHGRLLSKLTGVPFVCGVDNNSKALIDQFNKGGTCLIGTTGILGEGCDTRPTEYVIIASLGKSKPQFMQMVGRGLRKHPGKTSCKVIIFKDKSHKWTTSHFNEQVKVLKEEYGVIPVKL